MAASIRYLPFEPLRQPLSLHSIAVSRKGAKA